MKKLRLLLVLFTCSQAFAQKYYTKTGSIDFEASVPAFEPVKASHSSVTALLDTTSGEIAILSLMKGFRFRNALMEEHFNENYVESDTYPKAVFKGKIQGFSIEKLEAAQSFAVTGTLSLHGTSKTIETTIQIQLVDEVMKLQTTFSVAPADFEIEIPSVVSDKISDAISISANFNLFKK